MFAGFRKNCVKNRNKQQLIPKTVLNSSFYKKGKRFYSLSFSKIKKSVFKIESSTM